jgi:uncharacterized protein
VVIVCGADPLIALAQVERLDLLLRIAGGELHISDSVWQEVVRRGVADDIITAKLLHTLVHARKLRHHRIKLAAGDPTLALGDEETLALAVQMNADLVLLDDPLARQAACELGLKVRGSVATLLESARRGYITEEQARKLAYRMATRAAAWIDPDLVEMIQLWKSNLKPTDRCCSRSPTA